MAFDAFLKIDGIDGESTDTKHKDWIDVLAYSWKVDQPQSRAARSGTAATRRAQFHDFIITKHIDKASPKLMLACASGQHLKQATLEICRAGGDKQPFIDFKLTDVLITSLQPSGANQSEDLSREEVSLSYAQIEWRYTKVDPQSGITAEIVTAGWNIKQNKKV